MITIELLDQLLSYYCSKFQITWDLCYDTEKFLRFVRAVTGVPIDQIRANSNYKTWKFDREEDCYFLHDRQEGEV